MELSDLLQYSAIGIGSIPVILIIASGIAQSRNNYLSAKNFYKRLPEDKQGVIGHPSKFKFFTETMKDSPKLVYLATKGKDMNDDSFLKYVKPLGDDYLKLHVLGRLLDGAK